VYAKVGANRYGVGRNSCKRLENGLPKRQGRQDSNLQRPVLETSRRTTDLQGKRRVDASCGTVCGPRRHRTAERLAGRQPVRPELEARERLIES
jgi:hypothetical protein